MIEDVFGNERYSFGSQKNTFFLDPLHRFITDVISGTDGLYVIYVERKDVLIVDCVDDSVCVKSVSECILGCTECGILPADRIDCENGSSSDSNNTSFQAYLPCNYVVS